MTAEKNKKATAAEEPSGFTEAAGADEHRVYLNVLEAYKEAEKKRNSYKKYGPLAVMLSAVMFLLLIIGLDSKIDFLIMWVATILFCVALMIRAEYKYYKFRVMLGLSEDEENAGEDEEDGDSEEIPPGAEPKAEKAPKKPPKK